jgi:hypothetical protein
MEEQMTKQ